MTRQTRHLAGAFAAMLFVGLSWGANLPVTKVMLLHFDLIPMAAVRTVAAAVSLAVLLWLVEGRRALRIDLRPGRSAKSSPAEKCSPCPKRTPTRSSRSFPSHS